jgi:spore coat polysaccharide biosynthesis predicted glycosyltransferase SpsG
MKNEKVALKIAVRADGHKRIGMGHLYRMLTLSRYLRQEYGAETTFITRNNAQALKLIDRFQFDVLPLAFNISSADEIRQVRQFLANIYPHILCVDLLKRCNDMAYMKSLRTHPELTLVAFNDTHRRTDIAADIIFNVSVFQRTEYYRKQKNRTYYLGLDYVLLPEGYTLSSEAYEVREKPERLLICMGGSDHHNLTYRVLSAIDQSRLSFSIDVVVNSAFFPPQQIGPFAHSLKHSTRVVFDPDGLTSLLRRADIAITAAGTTLVERICAGVPGITISQLRHQAALAEEVARRGAGLDLGLHSLSDLDALVTLFDRLYLDQALRLKISEEGRKLVDGRGLARTSQLISRRAAERCHSKGDNHAT